MIVRCKRGYNSSRDSSKRRPYEGESSIQRSEHISLDSTSIVVPSPDSLGRWDPACSMQGKQYRLFVKENRLRRDLRVVAGTKSISLVLAPAASSSMIYRDLCFRISDKVDLEGTTHFKAASSDAESRICSIANDSIIPNTTNLEAISFTHRSWKMERLCRLRKIH